jgi:hypothetical protein
MSIGFLQDIVTVSKALIIRHLVDKTNLSRNQANKAIRLHGLRLEKEYWDLCFESLKKYEKTGVRMYILGRGICTVFPRLAYITGDDPALHRYCLVYEGNANHSGIYCTYSVKIHGVYDPNTQILRNYDEIMTLYPLSESGMRKKELHIPQLHREKEATKALAELSLHYFRNPTCGVPMGYTARDVRNNIFRSRL